MKRSFCLLANQPLFAVGICTLLWSTASGGTVTVWGGGQTNTPPGLNNISGLSSSVEHTLAVTSSGTVIAWGFDFDGQCDVPGGLNNVIAVAAGPGFSVALKADGTVVAWGANEYGQCHVPPSLQNVVAIAAGRTHSLALKFDGTVVAWGSDAFGQCDIPAGLNASAIVAAGDYSLALLSNGTVVGWGANDSGQTSIPGGLGNVVAIAGNIDYCLALRSDGTVAGWGKVPSIPGLSGIVGIAAGEDHCLAVNSAGLVTAWGGDESGQIDVPGGLATVSGVRAAWNYSLALSGGGGLAPFQLTNPHWNGNTFSVSLSSQSGRSYTLQYKNSLANAPWTALSPVSGNGGLLVLTDASASGSQRFYRVSAQ